MHTVHFTKWVLPNLVSSSVVQLEMMCMWWERFSSESEAFSLWISEKEKELEAVNSTSSLDPLDKHISTVEVCVVSHSFLRCNSLPWFSSHGGFYNFRSVLEVRQI